MNTRNKYRKSKDKKSIRTKQVKESKRKSPKKAKGSFQPGFNIPNKGSK